MKTLVLVKSPEFITEEIINACQKVVTDSIPLFVKKIDFTSGRINKCAYNVKDYIEKYGGEIVYGWEVTEWKKVLIQMIGHAIVSLNGDLFCVTPTKYGNNQILFVKDANVTFNFSDINSRMPSINIPLNDSKMVIRFIELEDEIHKIKCKYLVASGTMLVQGTDAILLKELESEKQSLLQKIIYFYKY